MGKKRGDGDGVGERVNERVKASGNSMIWTKCTKRVGDEIKAVM